MPAGPLAKVSVGGVSSPSSQTAWVTVGSCGSSATSTASAKRGTVSAPTPPSEPVGPAPAFCDAVMLIVRAWRLPVTLPGGFPHVRVAWYSTTIVSPASTSSIVLTALICPLDHVPENDVPVIVSSSSAT
ncbi:hypothetical protein L600_000900001050 [Isoptericola variabilis J7]|nr:hypothetical protein L600_000900001050 [Isoptericola variabilis J7]